ncbi:MAG: tRNA threonylcarbamoyladenosine dehydratase [Clostridia bacterium]|nr:tRNA threonylcarbamoyladenosine dehydratase [Clostridia bacterium]
MIEEALSRTALLLGEAAVKRLNNARVAVFGVGGVGGYVAEALARSGVGTLDLVDNDTVSVSNINRQIVALHSTVGRYKTEVMAERIRDIRPETVVHEFRVFFLPDNAAEFDFTVYDYVVDAVDTVSAKIAIAEQALAAGVPMISCMGTGNKLDPSKLVLTDLSQTSVCPLARVMRRELRARGIEHQPVLYSTEPAQPHRGSDSDERVPASTAFVPPVAGLMIAGEVVRALSAAE